MGGIDQVSEAIGSLTAKVDILIGKVDGIARDGCGPCRDNTGRITAMERKNGNGNGNGTYLKWGSLVVHGPTGILIIVVGYLVARSHGWM